MSPLRALLTAPAGEAAEANAALWAVEQLGLVEVVRYLPDGKVKWRRTVAGDKRMGVLQ
jgi:hypothetical protein